MLSKITKRDMIEYFELCSTETDIDVARAVELTLHAEKTGEAIGEYGTSLAKWNNSLSGEPEYSCYSDPYYFCDVWLCWKHCSRQYLKNLSSKKSFGKLLLDIFSEVKTVADIGCGPGYSTAALTQLFPNANVIGTNFEDSPQFRIATKLSKEYGFSVIPELTEQTDLIFASEYFEHIQEPIAHVNDIIDRCDPTYLVIANAFGVANVIGHFDTYKVGNLAVSSKKISRMFNDNMRRRGYFKLTTNCWNGRPVVWSKYDSVLDI